MNAKWNGPSSKCNLVSLVGVAGIVLAATPASAETFTQWAPVVRATPVYVHVSEPRQQCWTERVTTSEYIDRNGVPLADITDGITGGTLNRVPRGDNSPGSGTSVAITGSTLAASIDRARAGITVAPVTRDVERCRTIDAGRDVLDGYDVTYRYQDRDLTTRLPYPPGDRIPLRVAVEPAPRQ